MHEYRRLKGPKDRTGLNFSELGRKLVEESSVANELELLGIKYHNLITADASGNITAQGVFDLQKSGSGQALPSMRFFANNDGYSPSYKVGVSFWHNRTSGYLDSTLVYGGNSNSYFEIGQHDGSSYTRQYRINGGRHLFGSSVVDDGSTIAQFGGAGKFYAPSVSGGKSVALTMLNSGTGENTKATLDFNIAYTRYAGISGGYGAASPELSFDIQGVDRLALTNGGVNTFGTLTHSGTVNYTSVSGTGSIATFGYSDGANYARIGAYAGYSELVAESGHLLLGASAGKAILFYANGVQQASLNSGGRFLLGPVTDDGSTRMQVDGSGSFSGAVSANGVRLQGTSGIYANAASKLWRPAQQIGSQANSGLYGLCLTYLADYYDGGWKSSGGGTATALTIDEGIFSVHRSQGVSEYGADLIWTTDLTVRDGNLGVGTISPASRLDVAESGDDAVMSLSVSGVQRWQLKTERATGHFLIHDQTSRNVKARFSTDGVEFSGSGRFSGNVRLDQGKSLNLYNAAGNNWTSLSMPLVGGDGEVDFRITTKTGVFDFGATGNLGVGLAAHTWYGNRRAIEVGGNSVAALGLLSGITEVNSNFYYDSNAAAIRIHSGYAGAITFNNAVSGGYGWRIAGSDAAGTAANLVTKMALDLNGLRVGDVTSDGVSALQVGGLGRFTGGIKNGGGWVNRCYFSPIGPARVMTVVCALQYVVEITVTACGNQANQSSQAKFLATRRDYSASAHIYVVQNSVFGTGATISVAYSDVGDTRTYTLTFSNAADGANNNWIVETKNYGAAIVPDDGFTE